MEKNTMNSDILHKSIMANTSTIWQQAAHTTYHLLAAHQEIQKTAYLLTKNNWRIFAGEGGRVRKWAISRKITRQKEQQDYAEEHKRR